MRKLMNLLGRAEFHIFLFCLSLILFSYPLLIMSNTEQPDRVYLSLFVPWGVIIVFLFVVTRSYIVSGPEEGAAREKGEVDDV
jgi:hypothetical protein